MRLTKPSQDRCLCGWSDRARSLQLRLPPINSAICRQPASGCNVIGCSRSQECHRQHQSRSPPLMLPAAFAFSNSGMTALLSSVGKADGGFRLVERSLQIFRSACRPWFRLRAFECNINIQICGGFFGARTSLLARIDVETLGNQWMR